MVFLASVRSIIEYGIVGGRGCGPSVFQPLILLHKKIIKICLKRAIGYPTDLIYKEFNVLSIDQLCAIDLMKFVYLRQIEFPISSDHGYATRRQDRVFLDEPRCRTAAASAHAAFRGPRIFNSLGPNITGLSTYYSFKKELCRFVEGTI